MDKDRILVIIPARSGSKGMVNKNLANFMGAPLVVRTVNQALRIFNEDQVFVSTDSVEYKKIIESSTGLCIPELRPDYISGDYATNDEYIDHAVALFNESDNRLTHILILQPTSPLRGDDDIEDAIKYNLATEDLLASVCIARSNPYYLHRIKDMDGKIRPLLSSAANRRQDVPVVYELNGAIFLFSIEGFRKNNNSMKFESVLPFEMKWTRSIDIDDEMDLRIAELLFSCK